MIIAMLTTIDNPYDPFTHYEDWDAFDQDKGYYSSGLVGRIAITSHDLSDDDEQRTIEAAIDEIVLLNISGKHIKVTKEVKD